MKTYSPTAASQRGMAIISALLIAAVVAVIAGGMLSRQTVFTRALEAEQSRVQGAWMLQGALEISRQWLWDAQQREPLIRLDQPWAQPLVMGPLGVGSRGFEGRLDDEQGKFNLRNLVANERIDEEQLGHFQRLCELLGLNATLSQRISQRVIASYPRLLNPDLANQAPLNHGFDSGRSTSPNAARKPLPPTRPMLRRVEDLRGIEGITEAVLAKVTPFITILPANTWLNSNTATAPVLAAYVPGLSIERAQALIAERDAGQWFINRGDFVNRLRMPQLELTTIKVGITSDWFRLRGQAGGEQRRVSLDALLQRSADRLPRVIWSRVGV
ncbi:MULTISPECIES: type II secretion system minor pseudopilin GspK [unclassified Pseudomonas]|uniref:type II secretion system minor pseudopilin GspK n=1 Tax=unclassified Pseudomonas TaxID=196821 RepID=UPI002AC98D38|nr:MULTISPECIES: type II secretion system minor pseudopilin GspK [unclassified Pseudomonas]MEB0048387.1 type II secretion system minor pseudopilin GspK [Pseudomonas sp. Dout3]MEB0097557.1 type II secretion system minor pseudopilin GspK [Pseudomonas sp. DC1.2]WPX56747.1 type II secretion system minor pseudopilin GspK [Pseudomonas sp. DC1.2]